MWFHGVESVHREFSLPVCALMSVPNLRLTVFRLPIPSSSYIYADVKHTWKRGFTWTERVHLVRDFISVRIYMYSSVWVCVTMMLLCRSMITFTCVCLCVWVFVYVSLYVCVCVYLWVCCVSRQRNDGYYRSIQIASFRCGHDPRFYVTTRWGHQ